VAAGAAHRQAPGVDTWEHLVVTQDTARGELVLTPDPVELRTNRYDAGLRTLTAVLDELGERGWRLVAVRGDEFWLTRPAQDARAERGHVL
jgi:hypothetical protein